MESVSSGRACFWATLSSSSCSIYFDLGVLFPSNVVVGTVNAVMILALYMLISTIGSVYVNKHNISKFL